MARVYLDAVNPRIERFAGPTIHEVHIDGAMSNISIAYRNDQYIADQVFPIIPVQHQSDKYFKFDKAAWFRNEAQIRAYGTRAARSDYSITQSAPYAAVEYALASGLPDEIRANADDPLRPEVEKTEFVTDKILLKLEYDVATLVNTSGNWTNSGAPSNGAWDADTSDPIKDVVGGSSSVRETIRGTIGRYPNTLVMGATVWAALMRHPDLLDRVKYTQMGVVTQQLVASLFQVDKVLVGTAIINNAAEQATDSFADVWGKFAWFGWVPPSAGLMIPAAGYVFAWKQRQVNRYREEQEHQDLFECLMNYDKKVTSADSGYLLTSVVS